MANITVSNITASSASFRYTGEETTYPYKWFECNNESSPKGKVTSWKILGLTANTTYTVNYYGSNSDSGYSKYPLGTATFTTSSLINISTAVYPAGAGTTTGGGSYPEGSTVTLTATANTGYEFNYWDLDGAGRSSNNPYIINSVSSSYAGTYTACFSLKKYTVTLNKGAGVADIYYRLGTSGNWTEYSAAFSVNHNQKVQAYCTANTGYTAGYTQSNPLEFTVTSTTSQKLTATIKKYTVTFKSSDTTKGTVNISEITNVPYRTSLYGSGTVNYVTIDTYGTCTATPNTGYKFVNWTDSGRGQEIEGDRTFTANFESQTYTITYKPGATSGVTPNEEYTQTKTHDIDLKLLGKTYSKSNHTQVGWSFISTDEGKDYELSDIYTTNAKATFVPYWEKDTYTITYHISDERFGNISKTTGKIDFEEPIAIEGNIITTKSKSTTYSTKCNLNTNIPGSSFGGWYYGKPGNLDTEVKSGDTLSKDVDITAKINYQFMWTSNDSEYIMPGQRISLIRADIWNLFGQILNMAETKLGFNPTIFTKVTAGQSFLASSYNAYVDVIKKCIKEMVRIGILPAEYVLNKVAVGDTIEASMFYNKFAGSSLSGAINIIIDYLKLF